MQIKRAFLFIPSLRDMRYSKYTLLSPVKPYIYPLPWHKDTLSRMPLKVLAPRISIA